jgi:L-lactate dehydrogenase complex protein LldG
MTDIGPTPAHDVARQTILRRIRDALGPDPHTPEVPRGYATTSDLDPDAVTSRFADRVDDYHATVHRTGHADLPTTLAALVTASGAGRIGVPVGLDDTWLTELPDHLEIIHDQPNHDTAALDVLELVITAATVGIAETGTIVLDASPDQGRRALTLVPDHHICVITTHQIVHTVPEALHRLDATRPLTMISGPSATSDIELDRVEGVHGPRTLHVVIVHDHDRSGPAGS